MPRPAAVALRSKPVFIKNNSIKSPKLQKSTKLHSYIHYEIICILTACFSFSFAILSARRVAISIGDRGLSYCIAHSANTLALVRFLTIGGRFGLESGLLKTDFSVSNL